MGIEERIIGSLSWEVDFMRKRLLLSVAFVITVLCSGCGEQHTSKPVYFDAIGVSFKDSEGYVYDLFVDPYGWLYYRPQSPNDASMCQLIGEDGRPTKDYSSLAEYITLKEE